MALNRWHRVTRRMEGIRIESVWGMWRGRDLDRPGIDGPWEGNGARYSITCCGCTTTIRSGKRSAGEIEARERG